MGQFDYLLGAQQPQIPSPLAMAGTGMSLANAANSLAQGRMNLAAQQQYAQAVPMLAQGAPLDQIAQQFPLAYAKILSDVKQNQLTQAQIEKEQASAAASKADAFKGSFGIAGNLANGLVQKVQQGQPLTPMDKQQLAAQATHSFAIAGYDPKSINVPSVMSPDADWVNFAQTVAGAATTPEAAANIWKIGQMTPAEKQKALAEGNLATVSAQMKPFEAQTGRISANASAENAQTTRLEFQNPTPQVSPLTGGMVAPQRTIGPGGAVQTTAAPVNSPTGQPVQVGLGASGTAQMPAAEARTKSELENVQLGQRVQQILPALKQLAQSGYNGPIAGSETGKTVLSTLESMGMLTPDASAKLGSMRASDAMVAELLGPMARQMSSRGSNMALKIVMGAKAGSENPLSTRLAMIDALNADANNLVNTGNAYSKYLSANPSDFTGSGFKPPSPTLPASQAPPRMGEVRDGYLFKGGDPASPSSWAKVGS